MLAEGSYKYIRTLIVDEPEELYHLTLDPDELTNLATQPGNQALLEKFREKAVEELERTEAGFVDHLPRPSTL